MRHVVMYQDEDGYWFVQCPSLPGCFSQGETPDEALTNIREAISLWIEEAIEHGDEIPPDHEIQLATV